jgi:hypothetical protein
VAAVVEDAHHNTAVDATLPTNIKMIPHKLIVMWRVILPLVAIV